tara:strand:+ start:61 stop:1629 length:1569 start_codon:yes stop_codon:yes gene_type:complete
MATLTPEIFGKAGRIRPRATGELPAGSMGARDIEVLSEAMFCFYFAIWRSRKKTEYLTRSGRGWEIWKYITTVAHVRSFAKQLNISSMVNRVINDKAFNSKIGKIYNFLSRNNEEWAGKLTAQMNAFFASSLTKFSGTYMVMRADVIPKGFNPYEVYAEISNKVKQHKDFTQKIDPDKWNPSDVWIFSPVAAQAMGAFVRNAKSSVIKDVEYKCGYMAELNAKIYMLYKLGQLYPVSLKAPGKGGVSVIAKNILNPTLKKEVEYQGLSFTRDNIDVKLNFAVHIKKKVNGQWRVEQKDYMIGRMKTKGATVGGFGSGGGSRLEIEISRPKGLGARFGGIGTNIQEVVIEKTDTTGILALDRIRHKFPDLYRKYKWGGTGNWQGREQYAKELQRVGKSNQNEFVEEIQPYTDALFRYLNNSPVNWDPPQSVLSNKPGVVFVSKTHAGEVGVAIDGIVRNFMKSIVLENLYNIASSTAVQTGAAQEQIERRAGSLSSALKADIQRFPPAKADMIWESGFHLVVM